jgi:hypothetical protein
MNEVSSSASQPSGLSSRCRNIYTSLLQLSRATGISKSVLRRARDMGSPGFIASNKFDTSLILPFIENHKQELDTTPNKDDTTAGESYAFYRKEIAKRDVILRDITISQKREELIDPADLKRFLTQLGVILSSVIKKQRQELMSKCIGYEKVIDENTQDVFKLINIEMEKWL